MARGWVLRLALAALAASAFFAPGCSEAGQGISSPDSQEVIASVGELAARGSDEDVIQIEVATISADPEVAAEAVRGLGSIRRPEAVEALKRVIGEETRPEVREEAAYQLGLHREAPPIPFLEQLLQRDASPRVRAAAASSLARLREWSDIPLLVDVAENDADVMVQGRAVAAVESMIGIRVGFDRHASAAERRKAVQRLRSVAMTAGAVLAPQDDRRRGGA